MVYFSKKSESMHKCGPDKWYAVSNIDQNLLVLYDDDPLPPIESELCGCVQ